MTVLRIDDPDAGYPGAPVKPLARKPVRRWAFNAAAVGAAAGFVLWFGWAVHAALARKGIYFSFDFLWNSAGVDLSEGWTLAWRGWLPTFESFSSGDTNAQALVVGLVNTLKVAVAAIVLSTIFGTLVGVGRLSTNWLVRQLSFGLVEVVRNTPLLIQIVFWYFAVVLQFPPASTAANMFGLVIASQSGVFLPFVAVSETATGVASAALAAGVAALLVALSGHLFDMGRIVRRGALALAAVLLVASIVAGFPLIPNPPVVTRFGASGGLPLSPELTALLLAIVVNSSAYVAEIVRGAIDALPKGQWEAAAALGLSRRSTLQEIILPQVFRVVLPSLGNRYISLMKDTSLGIAIGYPDLFNVYGTVSNQTGRNLEGVLIVMVTYLILSSLISSVVNLLNRRITGGTTR